MHRPSLVVLLISAACLAATDVGVDSIVLPPRDVWVGFTFAPAARIRNSAADTASVRTWFRLTDPSGDVRYSESLGSTLLAPGSETLTTFPEVTLWGPIGDWLASCSVHAATDTAPANDTFSKGFHLHIG